MSHDVCQECCGYHGAKSNVYLHSVLAGILRPAITTTAHLFMAPAKFEDDSRQPSPDAAEPEHGRVRRAAARRSDSLRQRAINSLNGGEDVIESDSEPVVHPRCSAQLPRRQRVMAPPLPEGPVAGGSLGEWGHKVSRTRVTRPRREFSSDGGGGFSQRYDVCTVSVTSSAHHSAQFGSSLSLHEVLEYMCCIGFHIGTARKRACVNMRRLCAGSSWMAIATALSMRSRVRMMMMQTCLLRWH